MKKEQIEEEFKKIDYEIRVNKLDFTPYPHNLVKRREFLLFAQVHLGNILGTKLKKTDVAKNLRLGFITE